MYRSSESSAANSTRQSSEDARSYTHTQSESGLRSDVPHMTMAAPASVVEVYVHQARNLPTVGGAAQSDFYCVTEVTDSRQMYETHVVSDSLHPVWNESHQVKVSFAHEQMITVTVYGERPGKEDEFMGVVVVPVARVQGGAREQEGGWYEIRGAENEMVSGPDGLTKIELTFVHKLAERGHEATIGWLTKRHNVTKAWERRFFILDPYNQILRFFSSPEAAQKSTPHVLGEMNVRCCDVVEGLDKIGGVTNPSSEISMVAGHIPDSCFIKVTTNWMTLIVYADNQKEADNWVNSIHAVGNPPGIRHLPPPPTLNAPRGTNTINNSSAAPTAPTDGAARAPVRPISPEESTTQEKRSTRSWATFEDEEDIPIAPMSMPRKADPSFGAMVNMLSQAPQQKKTLHDPPRPQQLLQGSPPPPVPQLSPGRITSPVMLRSPEFEPGQDDELARKHDSARKALAESVLRNKELENMIRKLVGSGSPVHASLEMTRKELAESKLKVRELESDMEEMRHTVRTPAVLEEKQKQMEKALTETNQMLMESATELKTLKAEKKKLAEDKKKLIADNTELSQRFEAARQALAKQVRLDKNFGKGLVDNMSESRERESALEKKLRDVEARALVAAQGFQASAAAHEEEKEALSNEVKRLKELLDEKGVPHNAFQMEADKKQIAQLQKKLESERKEIEEERKAMERERGTLGMLRDQLQRQQNASRLGASQMGASQMGASQSQIQMSPRMGVSQISPRTSQINPAQYAPSQATQRSTVDESAINGILDHYLGAQGGLVSPGRKVPTIVDDGAYRAASRSPSPPRQRSPTYSPGGSPIRLMGHASPYITTPSFGERLSVA